MVDAPVMPDAQDVRKFPGVTLFNTPSTLAAVASFYQKQLPAAGWKLLDKPIIVKTMALLRFAQGKQQLSVVSPCLPRIGRRSASFWGLCQARRPLQQQRQPRERAGSEAQVCGSSPLTVADGCFHALSGNDIARRPRCAYVF